MHLQAPDKTHVIRELNDSLRRNFRGGKVVLTHSVAELPDMVKAGALLQMSRFEAFTPENDPTGEHDMGSFDFCQRRFLFKIDYYDNNLEYGSEDPADPHKTQRVLTLMLSEDY